jgi:hypothetical protein
VGRRSERYASQPTPIDPDDPELAVLPREGKLLSIGRPCRCEDGAADDPAEAPAVGAYDIQPDLPIVVLGVQIGNPTPVGRPRCAFCITVVAAVLSVTCEDVALALEGQDDDASFEAGGRLFEGLEQQRLSVRRPIEDTAAATQYSSPAAAVGPHDPNDVHVGR